MEYSVFRLWSYRAVKDILILPVGVDNLVRLVLIYTNPKNKKSSSHFSCPSAALLKCCHEVKSEYNEQHSCSSLR